MGNLNNYNKFDFDHVLTSLLKKSFTQNKESSTIYLKQDKIFFFESRFECLSVYEKHFVNVYRVFDHKLGKERNMKVVNLPKDTGKNKEIEAYLKKFIKETKSYNRELVKVEEIYFDESSNRSSNCKLLILEEAQDFLTLNDLSNQIAKLYKSYTTPEEIHKWLNILLSLFIQSLNSLKMIDRNPSLNIYNVVVQQLSKDEFVLKFSDLELKYVINKYFEGKNLGHLYFESIKTGFIVNVFCIIFYLSSRIFSVDKRESFRNVYEQPLQKIIDKTYINIQQDEFFNLISSEKIYVNYTLLKMLSEFFLAVLANKTEILRKLLSEVHGLVSEFFQIVFSTLSYNNSSFRLLKILSQEHKESFWEIAKNLKPEITFNFIQSYIIHLKCHSDKFDFMPLLSKMASRLKEIYPFTYQKKLIESGSFPLLIACVNNLKIDFPDFFLFFENLSVDNTNTFVHLLEKLKVPLDLNKITQNVKFSIFKILHRVDVKYLILNQKFFSFTQILEIIRKFPLTKLRKSQLRVVSELLIRMCLDSTTILKQAENFSCLLKTLLFLIQSKMSVRSSFLYSVCLSASIYPSGPIFSEFGVVCLTCNERICLICSHRCHHEHEIVSMAYSNNLCECSEKVKCNAQSSLEIPSHVLRPVAIFFDNGSKKESLNSIYLSNFSEFDNFRNGDIKEMTKSDFVRQNVFISTDNKIVTIQSNCLICQVENKDHQLALDETLFYFEVDVIMGGYYDQIAVGLTTTENFPEDEFVGYLNDSVGYHGDDGKCFVNSVSYDYGAKFGSGDTIGCGLTSNGNAYFTHNGVVLPLLSTKMEGNVYMLVSLRGKFSSIRINNQQYQYLFKHKKQRNLSNPLKYQEFSKSFCRLIAEERLLELLQKTFTENFYQNKNIGLMYKKFCSLMNAFCKTEKKELMCYLREDPKVEFQRAEIKNLKEITEENPKNDINPHQFFLEESKEITKPAEIRAKVKAHLSQISPNNTEKRECGCRDSKCFVF